MATGIIIPPQSIGAALADKHLARFVVDVIDGLDLSAMFKSYRGTDSACYHPALLPPAKACTERGAGVLLLAREMGVLKLGTVALDGTMIQADAGAGA